MMDDYTLPFWIYLGVLTVFVGGAMKKILASHLSAASTLVAWLGATVLVERLWPFCLPAVLLAVCLYYATRSSPVPSALPAHGKAVFITGKTRLRPYPQVEQLCGYKMVLFPRLAVGRWMLKFVLDL